MTDTQNTQPQTNQPAAPVVAAPAEATPASVPTPAEQTQTEEERKREAEERRKQLKENLDKIVNNYNGFKDFMGGLSTKALFGIVLAAASILYLTPDCRGLRAPRDIYSNGNRQPSGIAVDKNGVRSVIYCETPELLNELKVISQREGISLDKLVQKVDTERPYGRITDSEVSKYVKKN